MCDNSPIGYEINKNRFFSQADLLKHCRIIQTQQQRHNITETTGKTPQYKSNLQRTELIREQMSQCLKEIDE